ncbi:MAG: hypothetical protein KAI26_05780 [Nanoarchaeota archaeon]|nr:hypothetical protein [Nanoarchaeota archaeon]
MKATLKKKGDLDIILETEEETARLKNKPLRVRIEKYNGRITGTELTLSYNKDAKFRDNIRIKPSTAFLVTSTLDITLNDQSYNNLRSCNPKKMHNHRSYVNKTKQFRKVSIYGPEETYVFLTT